MPFVFILPVTQFTRVFYRPAAHCWSPEPSCFITCVVEARQGVGCSVSLEKVNCPGHLVQQWIAVQRGNSLSFFTETLFLLCAGLYDMHVCMHVFAGVWLTCTCVCTHAKARDWFRVSFSITPTLCIETECLAQTQSPQSQHVSRASLSLGSPSFPPEI